MSAKTKQRTAAFTADTEGKTQSAPSVPSTVKSAAPNGRKVSGLPVGWRKVRLPEVAELNPRRFSNTIEDQDVVSFVPMKAVEEESGRLSAVDSKKWVDVKKGYTPFQNGDVIFAKITPCMENGKYALAKGPYGGRAAGSTEFHMFRPLPELDAQLLLHYLFGPQVRRAARMNMR